MNGFYKGTTGNSKSNWLGKTFSTSKSTGINNFKENGKVIEKYPFKFYKVNGKLKLDYNLKQNPWWLRLIIDDLKETSPDKYKGVMKIIILPVARFNLQK